MKEVDFKDRVPTHAGRVKLIPVEGQPNIFDTERADEPTEPGTPLDKATFESIVKSRLTGRFYEPTATRETVAGKSGLTVSPIPTSGWVYDADNRLIARSGNFVVKADSDQNTSANRVDDVFDSDGWQNVGGTEAWIEVYHMQAFKVRSIRFAIELQYTSRLIQLEIQGSTNGTTWQALGTYSSGELTFNTNMSYSLVNIGDYNYYRLVFTSDGSNRVTVKNLQYQLYDISSYKNNYILDKMPVVWDIGQRLTIYTPSNVNTYAVAENTLNGVKVNTVLQSGRRYELRYNGSTFDAKEV
jgi:hypothetical protein